LEEPLSKKSKSAGKSRGPKLPKEVAGMKIPKEWRRKGEKALAAASTPAGREVIAAGLSMAAAAAASAAARTKTARKMEAKAADVAGKAAEAGVKDMQVLADAVGSIAASALERLFAKKA
jgi:hypothetical protein